MPFCNQFNVNRGRTCCNGAFNLNCICRNVFRRRVFYGTVIVDLNTTTRFPMTRF